MEPALCLRSTKNSGAEEILKSGEERGKQLGGSVMSRQYQEMIVRNAKWRSYLNRVASETDEAQKAPKGPVLALTSVDVNREAREGQAVWFSYPVKRWYRNRRPL